MRVVGIAVVLLLVIAACAPSSMDADSPQSHACDMESQQAKRCDGSSEDTPERLQQLRVNAPNRKALSLRVLTAFRCPDAVTREAMTALDVCIANLDALTAQSTADAASRRAATHPAVAALLADERYAPARESYRTLKKQELVACASASGENRQSQGRTECDAAHLESVKAAATMRALMTERHIDLRDADALGLW